MSAVAERIETQVANIQQPNANPVMDMIRQAVAAGQPLDVIRELKDMAKELEMDAKRAQFDAAIADAKAEITPVVRTRDGHNGKYADFADVAAGVDPILSRYGLSYRHRSVVVDGRITVICKLSHKAGYFEETELPAPPDKTGNKNDLQAIGSTLTYLQRYTLLLALGLATARDTNGQLRGSDDYVNMEQIEELQGLIGQAGATVEQFCKVGQIDALADLRASDFARAKSWLNDRIKAKARAND